MSAVTEAKTGARRVSADLVVALLLALPVLLVRSPPMVDFAGHEAVVGVLRGWRDPSFLAGSVYRLNLGHPNQLQYLIAWPVAYVLGPSKGLEVSVAVGVASILLGAGRLAAHLGRPRWSALFVAPVAVGFYFQWGNIANLLGAGGLLVGLPLLDGFARAPRRRALAGVLLLFLGLYLAHEAALVVACVALALFALRAFSLRRALWCAVPCAFALALVLMQLRLQRLSPMNQAFVLVSPGVVERLLAIPVVVVGYQSERVIELLLFALCALPLAAARAVRPGGDAGGPPRDAATWPYGALAALLVLLYLTLPASYGGVFYFSHRFFPLGWALLVALAFRPRTSYPRAFRLAAYAVPSALAVVALPSFLAADASYRELDAVTAGLEPRSAVATLELDPVTQGAINPEGFSTRMAQGHIVAWKGGRSLHDYTQSPISPALLRASRRWDRIVLLTFLDPLSFPPHAAFSHFRYLLVHATSRAVQAAAARVVEPEARVVAAGASWVVFESRQPVTAVDAPEGAYPNPPGASLRDGLDAALNPPR